VDVEDARNHKEQEEMSENSEQTYQTKKTKNPPSFSEVAKLFKCRPKQVSTFCRKDPFNPSNEVSGYVCRAEGAMGGSLLITTINQRRLDEHQLIYGTPKLLYPYKDFETYELTVPECAQYFWANKWNGMNVLIFKYKDANNNIFVSAKSKGAPFLSDSQFGNFLTLTREVLQLKDGQPIDITHPLLKGLSNPEIQSKTFELCGRREPHLVAYDFDIALKPLFFTYFDGTIAPAIENPDTDIGPLKLSTEEVIRRIREFQKMDFETNEEFRRKNNLQRKYERNHFAVEGRVLYCLDEKGRLLRRTMYKVKPPDIEEVHWSNFDTTMQSRVREALEKIYEREKPLTEASLKEELDMGPKEWSRFGKDVMKYVESLKLEKLPLLEEDKRHVVVLVGVSGSGKTHFAKKLKEEGWTVFTDKNISTKFDEILKDKNAKVVVDRPHLTVPSRRSLITECKRHGVITIDCVFFKTPFPVCKERLIKDGRQDQISTLQEQFNNLKKPFQNEGFANVYVIASEEELATIFQRLSLEESPGTNAAQEDQVQDKKNIEQ